MNRGAHIEQIQAQMLVAHTFAEQLYDTIAFQLLVQLLEETIFFQITVQNVQLIHCFLLSRQQKTEESVLIDGILLVVLSCDTLFIAIAIYQSIHNQGFKTIFLCITRHPLPPPPYDLLEHQI